MSAANMGAMAEFDLRQIDRLLTTTRAVRKRLDLERPIEREVIQECIRIAIQAPTGGWYAQQWRWLVVTDPVKRARLAELYRGTFDAQQAPRPEDDPRTGRIAAKQGLTPDAMARTIDSGVYLANRLQDGHVLVIPCVRRSPSDSDTFEVATMFGSILPAVWSFQLALRARGLGTALTTLHLQQEHAAAVLLDIPDNVIQVGLIPVAYYTGRAFRPAVRRPAEEITYWNAWEATRNAD
jgi:nitroreductase